MDKLLLIGLGNPGEKYINTRHNIGFKIANALSNKFNSEFHLVKHGDLCNFSIKGHQIYLLKPTTFMNLSGKAVRHHFIDKKIKIKNLLIISDDLHLPFGAIRMKRKGGDGGHNGHKDIIHKLETNNYSRLKFGIGSDFSTGRQSGYVLDKWSSSEEAELNNFINIALDAIINFCTLGIDKSMLNYN